MRIAPGAHELVRDLQTRDLLAHPTDSDPFYYRRHEGLWFRGAKLHQFTARWNGSEWAATRRVHMFDPAAHGFYFGAPVSDLTAAIAETGSWSAAIAKSQPSPKEQTP